MSSKKNGPDSPGHPNWITRTVIVLVVSFPGILLFSDSAAQATLPYVFEASLSGINQVPVSNSGATGHVVAVREGNQLQITGSFSGLTSEYAVAHLRKARIGENGTMVFSLNPILSADGRGGIFDESVVLTDTQLEDLNDEAFYIDVQSTEKPEGEIRGQLLNSMTRTFSVAFFGSEENPAFGRALATLNATELRLFGLFANLTAGFSAASLHIGQAESAPPSVSLNADLDTESGSGTFLALRNIIALSDDMVRNLLEGNVWLRIYRHGVTQPEASGQIVAAPEGLLLYEAALGGANAVPAVNSPAVGRVSAILGMGFGNIPYLHVIGSFEYMENEFVEAGLFVGDIGQAGEMIAPLPVIRSTLSDQHNGRVIRMTDYNIPWEAAQLLKEGLVYIAVVTEGHDAGEIRGQLLPSHTRSLRATLTGAAEVPPVNSHASGSATVIVSGSELRLTGSFSDLEGDFTTAQLYIGAPHETADSFWTLTVRQNEHNRSGVFLSEAGNSLVLTDSWSAAIRKDRMYLNVYSSAYPTGELRGHFVNPPTVGNEPSTEIPKQFTLLGNYPNPFNPSTRITFDLHSDAQVQGEVFDLLGRRLLFIPGGLFPAGFSRSLQLDGSELSSGVYMYRVTSTFPNGSQVATGRMILAK